MAQATSKQTSTPSIQVVVDNTRSKPPLWKVYGGTGGGGGGQVDTETKNYLDAKVDAVKAQNDARFTEVLSAINRVDERVSHIGSPLTWWQMVSGAASVSLVVLTIILGILAFASDRFDGGIAASGMLDEVSKAQANRDAEQDAKSDEMLLILKEIAERPVQPSP